MPERPYSFDRSSAQSLADAHRNNLPPDRSVQSAGTHRQAGHNTSRTPDVVIVRNDTGAVLNRRFLVLKIGGIVATGFDADSDALVDQFLYNPILKGETPDASENEFGIALRPAGKGDTVRCVTGGYVECLVEVTDTAHEYCAPKPGTRDKLISASTGPAKIIDWSAAKSGTNDRWCTIKIAASPPSGGGGFITAKLLDDLSTATLYVDGLIIAKFGTVPGTSEVGDTVRLYNTIQTFEGLTGDFCHAVYRETVTSDYFEIFVKPCSTNSLNDPSIDPDPEPGAGGAGATSGGGSEPGGGLG